MNDQPAPDNKKQKHYTALVYFHGIGEQKRYEEVSRLVDELESYDRDQEKSEQERQKTTQQKEAVKHNSLLVTEFEFEEPRSDLLTRDIGYIPMTRKDVRGQDREYRFYDAYYANQTAGGQPPLEVFLWLLQLAYKPVKILFSSWRNISRLRRATLLGHWDRHAGKGRRSKPAETSLEEQEREKQRKENRQKLLDAYDTFRDIGLRGKFPKGAFSDFVKAFYDEKNQFPGYGRALFSRTQDPLSQLVRDAFGWWWRFVRVQLKIIFIVLTMLLTLALLLGGALMTVTGLLPLGWALVLGAVILLIGNGIRGFLRHYLGDLYLWTTYEETAAKNEKRRKILNTSMGYLSHVLQDNTCERVVVIGHSMGTTVAYDTILELARLNRAKKKEGSKREDLPLNRIQYLVTFGSVIDKVDYLFKTSSSPSYRYTSVVENLRGDLGTSPFSEFFDQKDKPEKLPLPHIHWINFWDQADLASSPLYTPINGKFYLQHNYMVDNYEVVNNCAPLPNNAHTTYLQNREVIASIYKLCFEDAQNFREFQQNLLSNKEDKLPMFGREKKGLPTTIPLLVLVALVPWVILLNLVPVFVSRGAPNIPLLIALGVNIGLALMTLAWDWGLRSRRHRRSQKTSVEEIHSKDQVAAA
jgi:hypothetical protein